MKFLLVGINSKYIHINPALYSLRAYAGFPDDTFVSEYTVNESAASIIEDIFKQCPDVIAFSCYIWNISIVKKMIPLLHEILPNADILLGGPEATYNAEELIMHFPQIKCIMLGEGEETFCELRETYISGISDLSDIKGLCLINAGRMTVTGERNPLDLDMIPFPYDDPGQFRNRIIYYESSRGCPYQCAYCLSSLDNTLRTKSIEKVKRELSFFIDNRVKQVKFVDRTFNCLHEHFQAILQYILENDNGYTNFHFEISADILTEQEIQLLSRIRRGCVRLEIGIQTTNNYTLKSVNRKADQENLFSNIRKLHNCGNLCLHLDMIAGLPYEDLKSFRNSFNEIIALHPDELQLGFLKVLKKTEISNKAENYGIFSDPEPPYEVIKTNWLSYSDLIELKHTEEMLDIYYNSHQYQHTIEKLLYDKGNDAYELFRELTAFYSSKGYRKNKPQRNALFYNLFDFLSQTYPTDKELFRELLTFDCYLRENCKCRPEFSKDIACYKEHIREITNNREEHIEPFKFSVWEKPEKIMPLKSDVVYIKFSYEKRDAFTNNAVFEIL